MRGAIDLGALRERSAPPAPPADPQPAPAGAPPGGAALADPQRPPAAVAGGGENIIDVTEATFQTEVLERSLTHPRGDRLLGRVV